MIDIQKYVKCDAEVHNIHADQNLLMYFMYKLVVGLSISLWYIGFQLINEPLDEIKQRYH